MKQVRKQSWKSCAQGPSIRASRLEPHFPRGCLNHHKSPQKGLLWTWKRGQRRSQWMTFTATDPGSVKSTPSSQGCFGIKGGRRVCGAPSGRHCTEQWVKVQMVLRYLHQALKENVPFKVIPPLGKNLKVNFYFSKILPKKKKNRRGRNTSQFLPWGQ